MNTTSNGSFVHLYPDHQQCCDEYTFLKKQLEVAHEQARGHEESLERCQKNVHLIDTRLAAIVPKLKEFERIHAERVKKQKQRDADTLVLKKHAYAKECWAYLVEHNIEEAILSRNHSSSTPHTPKYVGEWDFQHESLSWDDIIRAAHKCHYMRTLYDGDKFDHDYTFEELELAHKREEGTVGGFTTGDGREYGWHIYTIGPQISVWPNDIGFDIRPEFDKYNRYAYEAN